MKFTKILIANRGEIALRIIRAAKELGLKTAIVYTQADKNSLPVQLADEKICIGKAKPSESYLQIHQIISAAEALGADAIHPGYGFLSENPVFSEICEATGIQFIGPSKDIILQMGDKATARETMQKAGVPIVKGSDILKTQEEALQAGKDIGYPVLIKATAGGGGRGMRICISEEELLPNFEAAQMEAKQAFGNPDVYMEKYITNPKHIEVQVLGDAFGNAYHFFERDCSIQRRHQKLLEEAPGFVLPEKTRQKLLEASLNAVKEVKYIGVGTLEFLYDQSSDEFYFIEMNTRIQVEHPISEMVTQRDLVKYQIMAAMNEKFDFAQSDIKLRGHSIECRINAEDFTQDFKPNAGTITKLVIPGGFGVRVDTHIYQGYSLPPFYDSLVAKLIVWDKDRASAIRKMERCLNEFVIEGITTTIPFHQQLLKNEIFLKGDYTTRLLENI